MPKRYTKSERDFVFALALATKKPFSALEPIVRGLAENQMLGWLSPEANERFLDWSAQRGYIWARRYGWEMEDIEAADCTPLPPEEEIDDQLLRDRLRVKQHFLDRLTGETGDPYQNSNAFHRVTEQIEGQITRRMSRPLTPQVIIELVFSVIQRLEGRNADEAAVLQAITEEAARFRYLPAGI